MTLLGFTRDQVTNLGHLPNASGVKLPTGEVQVQAFRSELITKSLGHLILGNSEFVTTMVKVQSAVFPDASVAV